MNNKIAGFWVTLLFVFVLTYIGYVVDTYKPVTNNVSVGQMPKQPKHKESDYQLPELTPEENAVTDSIIKDTIKQAEVESEHKSIETMREEVIEILDGITEEDSTVVISFNMQWTPSWVQ